MQTTPNGPKAPQLIFNECRLRDRDEHAAGLTHVFADVAMQKHAPKAGFYYHHSCAIFGPIRLLQIATSGGGFSAINNDCVHIGFVVSGSARSLSRDQSLIGQPGQIGNLFRGYDPFTVEVAPHSVSQIVEIDTPALVAAARDRIGHAPALSDLPRSVDLRTAGGNALLRTALTTLNELKLLNASNLSALAVTSYSELLCNLLVATIFPDDLNLPQAEVSVQLSEQARQYLVAHSHEAIKITDLAATLGVSARALQYGFRRSFGYSPLQFLYACRLDNARMRLLAARPFDTVASIAWDCGFVQPGIFSARYRARYGEPPSQTLRRSK